MLEVWNADDETGSLSPTFFRLQRKKREKVLEKRIMGKGKNLFYSGSEQFLEELGSN